VVSVHLAAEPTGRPEDATARYVIDAGASTLTARAFATGLLASFGHNPTISIPDIEGEVSLDSEAIERSSVRLTIHADALAATGDMSDKDRNEINRKMHEEVLESDSYPGIAFESTHGSASQTGEGQYWVALNGQLTLHGVTRPHAVSGRVSLEGDTLRATGEFSVLLSDYEIRPVSAVGGAVKLKDEIKLSFTISARKA
jgi:polyisoprenoid-binding protein YceI